MVGDSLPGEWGVIGNKTTFTKISPCIRGIDSAREPYSAVVWDSSPVNAVICCCQFTWNCGDRIFSNVLSLMPAMVPRFVTRGASISDFTWSQRVLESCACWTWQVCEKAGAIRDSASAWVAHKMEPIPRTRYPLQKCESQQERPRSRFFAGKVQYKWLGGIQAFDWLVQWIACWQLV